MIQYFVSSLTEKNSNVGKASCFMEKNRIKLTEPLLKSPHEVVRMPGDISNAYMYVFTFACLCVNIYMFNTTFMHVFFFLVHKLLLFVIVHRSVPNVPYLLN